MVQQSIVLVLVLVLLGGLLVSGHVTRRETAEMLGLLKGQAEAVASNLAIASQSYMFATYLPELERLVERFANHPGVDGISIVDSVGKSMVEVVLIDGHVKKTGPGLEYPPPKDKAGYIQTNEKQLIVWKPIGSEYIYGWVRVSFSLDVIEKRLSFVRRDIAWVFTCFGILFVLGMAIFFRFHMRTIGAVADFASNLDQHYGEILDVSTYSRESALLVEAINQASLNLKMQELALSASFKDLETQKFALDQHSIVSITDTRGVITYANEKFCQVSQFDRHELLGNAHNMVNSGYHSKAFFAEMWRTISQGLVWRGQIKNRRKNGDHYWVDTTIVPFPDETGRPYQYVSIRTDITELKNYESTLRRLAAFPENNPGLVISLDSEGHLAYANPTTVALMQRLTQAGSPVMSFLPTNYLNLVRRCLATSLGISGMEVELFDKIWMWVFHPVKNQPVVHCYALEISERKQMENALIEKEKQISHTMKMQAIGTLAGGIAHDFNNILMAMMNYADLALMDSTPDSEQYNAIEQILNGGHRASDLVARILDFSRQDGSDQQTIMPEMFIKDILRLLRASLPTNALLREDYQTDKAIVVNPVQLQQVVMNLGVNAGQAIGTDQGVIEVILREEVLSEPVHTLQNTLQPGLYVVLIVKDNGKGMSEAIAQRIFEPFFTTKQVGEGNGMGLAAVHGIVKEAGGGVVVRSSPGEGAEFLVYFPPAKNDVVNN